MTRGGGWWAGRGGVGSGKSEVCHFAIVSYLFSRHQDGLEGKARRKTRQAANKWQQQAAAAATKTASKTRERESSDSPLTVAAAVRTINQSIGE